MREWLSEAKTIDAALYAAVAGTETPRLDAAMRGLSRAADGSKLWFGAAVSIAVLGGADGRRAARSGLVSLAIASAFAFATGVSQVQPALSAPLRALATLVGYSRVHTGVHFPADVLAGAFVGVSAAELANRLLARR